MRTLFTLNSLSEMMLPMFYLSFMSLQTSKHQLIIIINHLFFGLTNRNLYTIVRTALAHKFCPPNYINQCQPSYYTHNVSLNMIRYKTMGVIWVSDMWDIWGHVVIVIITKYRDINYLLVNG